MGHELWASPQLLCSVFCVRCLLQDVVGAAAEVSTAEDVHQENGKCLDESQAMQETVECEDDSRSTGTV